MKKEHAITVIAAPKAFIHVLNDLSIACLQKDADVVLVTSGLTKVPMVHFW